MEIVKLDEDNIEDYVNYVTEDVAENIGRMFYRGILAINDGTPVAGMVWEVRNLMLDSDNESSIIWLRIDSDDAADALFEEYSSMIRDDDVVQSNFSLPARTAAAETKALERAGFTVKFMEGDLIKARLSEIAELPLLKKIRPADSIRPLKTITQRGFVAGIKRFVAKGLYGICQDLPYLSRTYFENDISCYSEDDGEINGLLLFHLNPSGGLVVVIMGAIGSNYGKILPQLIKQSVTNAAEFYSPDTEIWIDRHNYASLALSEKLFPRGFGIPVYIGSRRESGT